MNRVTETLLLILLMNAGTLSAQTLYMPRNIQKAFHNGTRSENGTPGANYWQNEGTYDIHVKVAVKTKKIIGSEQIVYANNSPDTLWQLAIRFVNNLHKLEAPRSFYQTADFFTDGLQIHRLTIDDLDYNPDSLGVANWGTVHLFSLKKPILPHSTATMQIEWDYGLSERSGREGQIDSTTLYVAYSYPRVSVYDDYNGWDLIPHYGRQEFYNDFNDYSLSVTVPRNYVVWATGDLLNGKEVLQPEIWHRLHRSYTSDSVILIASKAEMRQGQVTTQKPWNTWHFKAANIMDVCFAVSNHYTWDAASVIVDTTTNRRVHVQSAYNDSARDFRNFTRWARYSLRYYSTRWPGVPYPYPTMTCFQGFADMEYPMMINDASISDLRLARMIQDHEIAHSYFPFYMGINEKRYAYMDEGWATTFEYLIGQEEFGKAYADSMYKAFRVVDWIRNPATEEDQPLITLSSQLRGDGYSYNSYVKASLSYLALRDLLGAERFRKALHFYMDAWHGKHPIPWDFFNAMNAGAGENLNWFFQNWFFSNYFIDLKLADVRMDGDTCRLKIINTGGFAIPFDIRLQYPDGATRILHQTPEVWAGGSQTIVLPIVTSSKPSKIVLDGGIFMDYTPADNRMSLTR